MAYRDEFPGALTPFPAENRGRVRNGKLVEISGCESRNVGREGDSYCELKAGRTCGNYPTVLVASPFLLSLGIPLAVDRLCFLHTFGGLATEKGAGFVAKRNFNHIPPAEVTIRRPFVGELGRGTRGGGGSRGGKTLLIVALQAHRGALRFHVNARGCGRFKRED